MYIAPTQGQTIPLGQKFDANRKAFITFTIFIIQL